MAAKGNKSLFLSFLGNWHSDTYILLLYEKERRKKLIKRHSHFINSLRARGNAAKDLSASFLLLFFSIF